MNKNILSNFYLEEFSKLDDFQKQYVEKDFNIHKVLANAGSGKTHSSIIKVLDYIINRNINPKDIVCISYTNKSAKILRDRYTNFFFNAYGCESLDEKEEILKDLKTPWMSTIHSFCFNLINNKLKYYNKNSSFSILNDNKSCRVLREVLINMIKRNLGIEVSLESTVVYGIYSLIMDIGNANEYCYFINLDLNEDFTINKIDEEIDLSLIEDSYSINNLKFKNEFVSIEKTLEEKIKQYAKRFTSVLENSKKLSNYSLDLNEKTSINFLSETICEFFKSKLQTHLLSYIDIIFISFIYNRKYKTLGKHFKIALIDEAQDIDYVNFGVFKGLVNFFDCKLILVGDPKQSLYSFRFADPNIIDKLESFFPNKDVQKSYLLSNYRSTQNLVTLSNMFSYNLKEYFDVKDSIAIKPKKSSVFFYKGFEKIDMELDYLANDILLKKEKHREFKNIVLLARTNQNLSELEPFLIKKRIPYKIKYDSHSLMNLSSFKFIYSLYCVIINTKDIDSFLELLEFIKGVGEKSLSKIKHLFITKYLNKGVLNENFINELKFSLKIPNIEEFYKWFLLDIWNFFQSAEFFTVDLNKRIFEILITRFNHLEYTEDNSVKYKFNNDIDLSISLNFFQIQKAVHTMNSIYESYNTDLFFRNLLEIERFYEVFNSLSSSQVDKDSVNKDCVLLSTVHGFKGLEADCVYLFMSSSLSPFTKSDALNDMCVMYVASTRAKNEFIMTDSLMLKTYNGSLRKGIKNPFLNIYIEGVKNLKNI